MSSMALLIVNGRNKMSKRTVSKMNRAIFANRFEGDKKILGYKPAKPREKKWLQFGNGRNEKVIEIPVLVSEGQIINPRKAFAREMARREKENE